MDEKLSFHPECEKSVKTRMEGLHPKAMNDVLTIRLVRVGSTWAEELDSKAFSFTICVQDELDSRRIPLTSLLVCVFSECRQSILPEPWCFD